MQWGKKSIERLDGLDPLLRQVLDRALSYQILDISIIQTVRSKEEQDEYFRTGKSKVKWPNGKHNVTEDSPLAKAADVAPYIPGRGVSWNKLHCCVLAGIILAAAKEEEVAIRWGGNWDMDSEPITDQDFQDLVHFELVEA